MSLSVNFLIVSSVFMDEFHAIFAIYIKRTSILYGSPFQALLMTICIKPCADNGFSQLYALSILSGFSSSSVRRSSGDVGNPNGIPPIGVLGFTILPAGFGPGTTCFGYGALYLNPPGTSIDPIKV